MILEKQKEAHVLSEGVQNDSIKMSLDLDSAQVLMQMLSKNLYSDAIGSTIRETASNALDSHRRANVKDAIIVSLNINKEGNYEFSVEDFGIGLNADDIEKIIGKYGKSTKRDSNNELGMFGLGFKAPLAYSSSFYFTCRKDGIERKYMMYEGEDVNTIDLLYEAETTERNGVKVIIPVLKNDVGNFYNKTQEQLAYFGNVYFNVNAEIYYSDKTISNDFNIHRSEHFQISELSQDSNLHICLDDVYYPIDFQKLGIDRISLPIGLRFNLSDGLFPTPNREAIRYTKEAKESILNKLRLFSNYCINSFNKNLKETENIGEVISFYKNELKYINIVDKKHQINFLEKYSDVKFKKPTIKGIKNLNLDFLRDKSTGLLSEYKIKFTLNNFKISTEKYKTSVSYFDLKNAYILKEKFNFNKKTYLRETLNPSEDIIFINKFKNHSLLPKDRWDCDNYYYILNLSIIPKNKWRTLIEDFQYIQQLALKDVEIVDDIVIPQKWIDDRKKKKVSISTGRSIKLEGEISCKIAENLLRYVDGQNCKFVSKVLDLKFVHKNPYLTVYTTHDNKSKLDVLFSICYKQKIKFITLNNSEYKKIEQLKIHNLIKYEEFMEGKNQSFKRIVTAYLVNNLINENKKVFINLNYLYDINLKECNDLKSLTKYKNDNYYYANDTILTAMLDLAVEQNLYDEQIYDVYLSSKEFLEKHQFLNTMLSKINHTDCSKEDVLPIIVDLFKYYKTRLDYKNYKLTEELIEEIV